MPIESAETVNKAAKLSTALRSRIGRMNDRLKREAEAEVARREALQPSAAHIEEQGRLLAAMLEQLGILEQTARLAGSGRGENQRRREQAAKSGAPRPGRRRS